MHCHANHNQFTTHGRGTPRVSAAGFVQAPCHPQHVTGTYREKSKACYVIKSEANYEW